MGRAFWPETPTPHRRNRLSNNVVPDCPALVPRAQSLTEQGGQAITGIRKNTAKTDTCGTEAINLFDRHLRFGPGALMFQWNTSPLQACRICCPDIGQEQTE